MAYDITCPYCFHKMDDTQVHFRSERVSVGRCEYIPEEYDDLEDFRVRHPESNEKKNIIKKIEEWEFFASGVSEKYDAFWSKFGGTTEENRTDDILGVRAHDRKVIDPNDINHRQYIKMQAQGPYIIDNDGMVTQIELTSGERCHRRVCPNCHNPLPNNYGKNPSKFVTIMGITGAGKTVYVSQLLKNMATYCSKVGLATIINSPSVINFVKNNPIIAGKRLPGSTPATSFQQPLFYEIIKGEGGGKNETHSFVLYDVAGEVFRDPNLIDRFAPFIKNTDGVIALLDPMQFSVFNNVAVSADRLGEATDIFNAIHNQLAGGEANRTSKIPFAVCISKADMKEVQEVLDNDLKQRLTQDVQTRYTVGGDIEAEFNATDYNPIGNALNNFMLVNEAPLSLILRNNYSSYAFFAFTAMGCDIGEYKDEQDRTYQAPNGPILPRRLEEPMLWLFHKLGYIASNEQVFSPARPIFYCPECGSPDTEKCEEYEKKGWGPWATETLYNRRCKLCQYRWFIEGN